MAMVGEKADDGEKTAEGEWAGRDEGWFEMGGMAMGVKFARNESRNACGADAVLNNAAAVGDGANAAAAGAGRAGVGTAMTTGLGGSVVRDWVVAANGVGEDGVVEEDNEAKSDDAVTVGREVVVVAAVVGPVPLDREANVKAVGGGAADKRMGEGKVLLLLEVGVEVEVGVGVEVEVEVGARAERI